MNRVVRFFGSIKLPEGQTITMYDPLSRQHYESDIIPMDVKVSFKENKMENIMISAGNSLKEYMQAMYPDKEYVIYDWEWIQ